MNTDLFDVRGRRVLVTGGGSGIGRMIAEGFVSAGAEVVIASRKLEALRTVADALPTGRCHVVQADLSTHQGCHDLAERVPEVISGLDVLVNNAGAVWSAPLEQFPAEGWDKVIALDLTAPFVLTQALLPLLEDAASATAPSRIINIGSADGLHVPPLETYAYSAAKAGLHHLTRHLAARLAPRHILVNAIAPGPFQSRMMAQSLSTMRDQIEDMVPLRRIGEPADIAGVVQMLCARAGAYITGAVIAVDGGMTSTL